MNGINGHPDEIGIIKSISSLSDWLIGPDGDIDNPIPVDRTPAPVLDYETGRKLLGDIKKY